MFDALHEITTASLDPTKGSTTEFLRVSPLQTSHLQLTFTLNCQLSTPSGQLQSKRFLGQLASHSLEDAWVHTLSSISLVPFIVPDDANSASSLKKRLARERANAYPHGHTVLVQESNIGVGAEPLCAPIEAVPDVGQDDQGRRTVSFLLSLTIPHHALGKNLVAIVCKLKNPAATIHGAGVGLGSPMMGTVARELHISNPLDVECTSNRVSHSMVLIACSVTNRSTAPLVVHSIQPDLLSSWLGSTLGSLADVRQDPRYRSAAPYHHGHVVGTLSEATSVVPIVPATGTSVFPVHLGPMEAYSAVFAVSLKPEYAAAADRAGKPAPMEGRMNVHTFVDHPAGNGSLEAVVSEKFNTVVVIKYGDDHLHQRHEEHVEWSFNPVYYGSA